MFSPECRFVITLLSLRHHELEYSDTITKYNITIAYHRRLQLQSHGLFREVTAQSRTACATSNNVLNNRSCSILTRIMYSSSVLLFVPYTIYSKQLNSLKQKEYYNVYTLLRTVCLKKTVTNIIPILIKFTNLISDTLLRALFTIRVILIITIQKTIVGSILYYDTSCRRLRSDGPQFLGLRKTIYVNLGIRIQEELH